MLQSNGINPTNGEKKLFLRGLWMNLTVSTSLASMKCKKKKKSGVFELEYESKKKKKVQITKGTFETVCV